MKTNIVLLLLLYSLTLSAQLAETNTSTLPVEESTNDPLKRILEKIFEKDNILNIHFDTRIDLNTTSIDGETQKSLFEGHTVKLVFSGEVYPGVRYLIRQRLNSSPIALRDNYGPATDFAFIELDAGEKWSFRIGKQWAQLGTFEIFYNFADVYLSSLINTDIDAYKTGINTAYKTGNQTFNFQMINSDSPQFTTEKYFNKAFAGFLLWEGSLFDGIIKTRYGLAAYQYNSKKTYNWLTTGTQININKFTTEIDWYMGDRNVEIRPDTAEIEPVKNRSLAINLKYNIGSFVPQLKGVWDKRKSKQENGFYENFGIQGALEYYPFKEKALKDLRFHAVYIYSNRNYYADFNSTSDQNTNTFLVGMRWFFKIK